MQVNKIFNKFENEKLELVSKKHIMKSFNKFIN